MDDPTPLEDMRLGETFCGHWHPNVPRPPKLTEPQQQAWARHLCIDLCGQPARAAGYRCDGCHREYERRTT